MKMTTGANLGKAISTIAELAGKLDGYARSAAATGIRQYDAEREILSQALEIGRHAMDLFLVLQGDGDLGPSVVTDDGKELQRSAEPAERALRTVFGEHVFAGYVYAAGAKQKVELRPIDARIELPKGKFSYLYEEFSQYFCVEQPFAAAADRLGAMLGKAPSVDSLERIGVRLGEQAAEFLESAPKPDPQEEGELLVVTADGKGVPLVKRDAERLPVFERRERPGNRRMATLGGVYTVDRYPRTAEQVLAALFREEAETPPADRPQPRFKHLRGCFSQPAEEGEEEISGTFEAFRWLRERVEERRCDGQPIVRLMDGQPSLWDAADACLDGLPDAEFVDILDIVHVAGYVWSAAKVFASSKERREAFAWTRLERILSGEAKGVIRGMRRMASQHGLRGTALKEVRRVCGYLENNLERMRYDEYLSKGYPIATGVIEGACRHLVKDRMERSGMRWSLAGAQAMLNVRAVLASSLWDDFKERRMAAEQRRLHPHANLAREHHLPVPRC
jgi:hypothetical protein